MKEIPLTKGFVALVDDEDYELLSQLSWSYSTGYARTRTTTSKFRELFGSLGLETSKVLMHRLVMRAAPGVHIDHRSTVRTDNQKSNLRVASYGDNAKNCGSKGGTSRFKGIYWEPTRGLWIVLIRCGNVQRHVGALSDEIEAAKRYDRACNFWHKEFARFNFPEDPQRFLPITHRAEPCRSLSGFWGVSTNWSKFSAQVSGQYLGVFDTAYDAAMYREYYIEKHNLTARMNFT